MARTKKALITGITGQDGSYLAELLLAKGYTVYGLVRRSSTFNTERIDHLIDREEAPFEWYRGDLQDTGTLLQVLRETEPDELYHLGAQSHVQVSFEMPVYTFDTVATGTLRLLETVRTLGLDCRIYNAASSEMYGDSAPPQSEDTPMRPRSPYAVAKLAAFRMCQHYREAYGMRIWNGILFNHESPRRGKTFVTRKITRTVARMAHGLGTQLVLGNLDSRRDWGFAPEYVEAMWRMLQAKTPKDYVIATGKNYSVRECVEAAFEHVGVHVQWKGEGMQEVGVAKSIDRDSPFRKMLKFAKGDVIVRKDAKYLRPAEVDDLLGDATLARKEIGWKANTQFPQLIATMVKHDLDSTETILHGTRRRNEEWRDYVV